MLVGLKRWIKLTRRFVNNDLSPGQTSVTHGASDDEVAAGVDVKLGVDVQGMVVCTTFSMLSFLRNSRVTTTTTRLQNIYPCVN